VSRGKVDDLFAVLAQRLHLGRKPNRAVLCPSLVQRRHAQRVPRCKERALAGTAIVQHKRKLAIEQVDKVLAMLEVLIKNVHAVMFNDFHMPTV